MFMYEIEKCENFFDGQAGLSEFFDHRNCIKRTLFIHKNVVTAARIIKTLNIDLRLDELKLS